MNLSDFTETALSTFLGAAVALSSSSLGQRRASKLAEEAAINSLILDLSAKRAFVVSDDWSWRDGEIDRIQGSVSHSRQLIRETRTSLRPRSKALPILRSMTRSCNLFLEIHEDGDTERTKQALITLSSEMTKHVTALSKLSPHYYGDRPGSAAL
ncbi:hypothetical protein [Nocardioides sp.]|uniref:hypothetical protein n=1 Tax=Nocardioides sp. TaxID=35761 RepID=UPI003514E6CE